MKRSADTAPETGSKPGDEQPSEAGFLQRWSRRKTEAARSDSEQSSPVADEAPAAASQEPVAIEAPVLTDADMPPIDSLDENSDYSGFFSPGVSEELRQRALRKLFRSPAFNELCPLEGEYHDCRGYEELGSVVTHDMRAQLEREAAELAKRTQTELEERVESLSHQSQPGDQPAPARVEHPPEESASANPVASRAIAKSPKLRRKSASVPAQRKRRR